MTDEVTVTQADREAAWRVRPACYVEDDRIKWMNGAYDGVRVIQVFAEARITATRELEAEVVSLKAERDRLREILDAIVAMQALRYGDATGTHLALSVLCETARQALKGE